jgi:sortase A
VPAAPAGRHSKPKTQPVADGAIRVVRPGASLVSTSLTIMGVLLLGAVLEVAVLGDLKHGRAQQVHYRELRAELATSVAPVSATDSNGTLLALGAPVAILEIPRLHLREVVGEGTTSGVLLDGPGHLRSSVLPGQAGISTVYGRQAAYGGPFRGLATLRPGDAITVVTGQGRQGFRVLGRRRAGDLVPPLPAGAGRLVLATGDGTRYAPGGVLRVDADLVTPVQPTPPSVFGSASLMESERPMRGDQGALVPLLLWAQALLLAALATVYLRARWGRWQTWTVAVPVLLVLGLNVTDQAARLLPNML